VNARSGWGQRSHGVNGRRQSLKREGGGGEVTGEPAKIEPTKKPGKKKNGKKLQEAEGNKGQFGGKGPGKGTGEKAAKKGKKRGVRFGFGPRCETAVGAPQR